MQTKERAMDKGKERSIKNQFVLEQRKNRNALKVERFKHSQGRVAILKEITGFLLSIFDKALEPYEYHKTSKRKIYPQYSRWDVKLFAQRSSARRRRQHANGKAIVWKEYKRIAII